jgi:hypothetical protein
MPGCGSSVAGVYPRSDVVSGWRLVEVTARVHLFVQHPDDLDRALPSDAIVKNINRSPDLRSVNRTARISDVEAADTWTEFRSLLRERAYWLVRNLPHSVGKNSRVPLSAVGAPTLGACRKDIGQINLCGVSEPKPRHAALTRALGSRRRQPFEIPFEVGIIDLGELAAFERISAGLDLGAEGLQSKGVFLPALLEYAQSVTDSFARILVFAGFDDLLNKRVLLGCQTDVPGRHLDLQQFR